MAELEDKTKIVLSKQPQLDFVGSYALRERVHTLVSVLHDKVSSFVRPALDDHRDSCIQQKKRLRSQVTAETRKKLDQIRDEFLQTFESLSSLHNAATKLLYLV